MILSGFEDIESVIRSQKKLISKQRKFITKTNALNKSIVRSLIKTANNWFYYNLILRF